MQQSSIQTATSPHRPRARRQAAGVVAQYIRELSTPATDAAPFAAPTRSTALAAPSLAPTVVALAPAANALELEARAA
jgi:hypothetical protein